MGGHRLGRARAHHRARSVHGRGHDSGGGPAAGRQCRGCGPEPRRLVHSEEGDRRLRPRRVAGGLRAGRGGRRRGDQALLQDHLPVLRRAGGRDVRLLGQAGAVPGAHLRGDGPALQLLRHREEGPREDHRPRCPAQPRRPGRDAAGTREVPGHRVHQVSES